MSKSQQIYALPLIIRERYGDCKGLGSALSELQSFASENAVLSVKASACESLANLYHYLLVSFIFLLGNITIDVVDCTHEVEHLRA